MEKYYLAVDIGASSGRHMLASMEDGRMKLEEIYRFPNGMDNVNGTLCWDVKRLFTEIKNGLKKCKELGRIPSFMGIDTWAVDYVLLDKENQILATVTAAPTGWMTRFMRRSHFPLYMPGPGSRSRSSIPFTS